MMIGAPFVLSEVEGRAPGAALAAPTLAPLSTDGEGVAG